MSRTATKADAEGTQPFDPRGYWERRLSSNAGLLGVGYTSLGESYNRWMYRLRRRVFSRAAGRIAVNWPTVSVLDIGSGTGFYLDLWQGLRVNRVDGLDLTDAAVSGLRTKYPHLEFFRRDIGDPQLVPLPRMYQVISAFDVLFHIVEDERYAAALRNVYALLEPGGWFLFSDLFLHSQALRSLHCSFRALRDVEALLRNCGFSTVERLPVFFLMNEPDDTGSRAHQLAWELFVHALRGRETLGQIAGACLYPVDLLCTRLMKESPTTELMICRRSLRGA